MERGVWGNSETRQTKDKNERERAILWQIWVPTVHVLCEISPANSQPSPGASPISHWRRWVKMSINSLSLYNFPIHPSNQALWKRCFSIDWVRLSDCAFQELFAASSCIRLACKSLCSSPLANALHEVGNEREGNTWWDRSIDPVDEGNNRDALLWENGASSPKRKYITHLMEELRKRCWIPHLGLICFRSPWEGSVAWWLHGWETRLLFVCCYTFLYKPGKKTYTYSYSHCFWLVSLHFSTRFLGQHPILILVLLGSVGRNHNSIGSIRTLTFWEQEEGSPSIFYTMHHLCAWIFKPLNHSLFLSLAPSSFFIGCKDLQSIWGGRQRLWIEK